MSAFFSVLVLYSTNQSRWWLCVLLSSVWLMSTFGTAYKSRCIARFNWLFKCSTGLTHTKPINRFTSHLSWTMECTSCTQWPITKNQFSFYFQSCSLFLSLSLFSGALLAWFVSILSYFFFGKMKLIMFYGVSTIHHIATGLTHQSSFCIDIFLALEIPMQCFFSRFCHRTQFKFQFTGVAHQKLCSAVNQLCRTCIQMPNRNSCSFIPKKKSVIAWTKTMANGNKHTMHSDNNTIDNSIFLLFLSYRLVVGCFFVCDDLLEE